MPIGTRPEIPFTQYLRPFGTPKHVTLPVSEDLAAKAADIIAAGYRFEVELLTTNEASATIVHPTKGDVDIALAGNGPAVPIAIAAMVHRFHERLTRKRRAA